MYVHVSNHLKEKVTWTADKRLWVINIIAKNIYSTKELKGTKEQMHFKFKSIHCYAVFSDVF